MSPRIEIVGDIEKAAPYIPWAKQQWSMQEGYWYKHVDNLLIEFNRSGSDGVIRIVAEGPQLVTTPRKITTMTPPVYSADSKVAKVYGVDFDCTEELSGSPEEFEQFYGNYHVVDSECEQIYSIYAPPHDLAGDIQENIQGYTRYAWTTNVSMEDVYTCYSEYVYQGGEPVIAGTMAPPEAAFKYGLIVGIGFNDKNELQLAQLVQIPRYYGYWKTDQGLKFGTNLPGTLVWRNEDPDKKWFVEFFTGNGLDAEYSDIVIYDRKDASRYGNSQWFYINGTWSQHSRVIPSNYTFEGLESVAGLLKTVYGLAPKAPELNDKAVMLTHKATSSSGASGEFTEIELPVKKVPEMSTTFTASTSPAWPADGSYYTVDITKDACVGNITVASTLANTTVSEIIAGIQYRVTLSNRCVAGQSAKLLTGNITVNGDFGLSSSAEISYTTKTGSWQNYVLTWQSPQHAWSEELGSDVIVGNIRTVTHMYTGTRVSYQESVSTGYCRYCSTWYLYSGIPYTTDPESFTREPEYLLPAIYAYTTTRTNITLAGSAGTPSCPTPPGTPDCPCCETYWESGTMPRNLWRIPSRKETYEWICS